MVNDLSAIRAKVIHGSGFISLVVGVHIDDDFIVNSRFATAKARRVAPARPQGLFDDRRGVLTRPPAGRGRRNISLKTRRELIDSSVKNRTN
jgi:hypothetical protein